MGRATFRGVWAHKGRFFMTALAVVLAVTFMSATLLLTGGIGSGAAGATEKAYAGIDVVVRSPAAPAADGGPGQAVIAARPAVSDAMVAKVAAVPGVSAAGVRLSYAQLARGGGHALGQTEAQMNIGMNWIADPHLNPFHVVVGRAPTADDEVVIDRATATHDGITVGDQLQVNTLTRKVPVTVVGIASYGDAEGVTLQSTTLFTPAAATQLFGGDGYAYIVAHGVPTDDAALHAALTGPDAGGPVEVISGTAMVLELQAQLDTQLSFIRVFLGAFAVIALIVGGSLIYNTFGVAVSQRTRELALLRTLGATGRQVFASVVGEAVIVGMLASTAGLLAGFGAELVLAQVLRLVGFSLLSGTIAVSSTSLGLPFLLGVTVTVIASLVPARRASRVEPVAALQENTTDLSATSTRRRWAGLVLLGAGIGLTLAGASQTAALLVVGGALAVLVGVFLAGPTLVSVLAAASAPGLRRLLGRPGALAARNTSREPRRSAATSNALMLGVAVVVLFSVITASINRSTAGTTVAGIQADTVVSSITTEIGLLLPTLPADLAAIPGVAVASPVKVAAATVNGSAAKIGSVDEASIGQVWNFGAVDGNPQSLSRGQVMVQSSKAAGVNVGDPIQIAMPDGTVVDQTVGGRFTNGFPGFDAPAYLVPSALFAAHQLVDNSMWILIKQADGADAAGVNRAIGSLLDGEVSAHVESAAAWADAGNTQVQTLRNVVWALSGMALIIALLGIANTITLAVHQRRRELGLLRSLGLTRAQLSTMVDIEAVMLAVQGALVGTFVGISGAWALLQAIHDPDAGVFAVPATTIITIIVAAIAAGAIVSLPPAWRAGRVPPLRAIVAD